MSIGRSRAKAYTTDRPSTTFADVAGYEGVKTELKGGRVTWIYPPGTVILKETFKAGGPPAKNERPLRLYGMIKDPQNPRAKGGWVWILRDPATGRETVYESPLCVDCHSYANGKHTYGDKNPRGEFRDFVFFPYVGRGKPY